MWFNLNRNGENRSLEGSILIKPLTARLSLYIYAKLDVPRDKSNCELTKKGRILCKTLNVNRVGY